ncbi:hypothetical protein Leryth_024269 [Lithospermum erythrorhizon]|nr:hypothetical protein Leryth_024269 [Lithospermum erythrorhizon]
MPKDRRMNSLSSDRARGSPYACSSKNSGNGRYKSPLPPTGDENEWEEARCPICMEHPHNCVLLLCSSSAKGCRPFMCDTSHRHSNCLDQFRKSRAAETTTDTPEIFPNSEGGPWRGGEPYVHSRSTRFHKQQPKLACPLCRGQISGWVVIEGARKHMNCKPRSCSLETCNFIGNYTDLRKHARVEHPTVRPAEADLTRQSEWRTLERQTDLEDTLSIFHSFGNDIDEDTFLDDALNESMFDDFLTGVNSESDDDWIYGSNSLMDLEYELEFSFLSDIFNSPIYDPVESISATNRESSNQISTRSRPNDETRRTPRRRWDTIPRRTRSASTRRRWDSSSVSRFRGSSR